MTPTASRPARFAPGTPAFTIVLSLSVALSALAIDTLLPAFGKIREAFGYGPGSTTVTGLVTAFTLGLGLGQIPAGLLADRFGRRPVLWGGLSIYVIGAIASLLAPSLPIMIAARVLWGIGAAGPRVATVAMVRDAYSGEAMARQMSYIMAVFLIAPMIAPTIGSALIAIGPWQLTVALPAAFAVLVLTLSFGLPATMRPEDRRPINPTQIWNGWRVVFAAPGSIAYLIMLTVTFGTFMAFIGSSEALIKETYGLGGYFPAVFGGISLMLAVAVMVNARLVERVGLKNMMLGPSWGVVAAAAGLTIAAIANRGVPPLWVFLTLLVAVLMLIQVLQTNLNAAAMVPLGQVAGAAAAVFGTVSMVVGSGVAAVISSLYHGPVTPFAVAFMVCGAICVVGVAQATRSTTTTAAAQPVSSP